MHTNLNLGSGDTRYPGYTNVDHRESTNIDIVDDVFTLGSIAFNSVDNILASHILEHASYDRTVTVLKRWREVLKKEGRLYVIVPDFSLVLNKFIKQYYSGEINFEYFNSRIFGNAEVAKVMYGYYNIDTVKGIMSYELAFHRAVFTKEMLIDRMKVAGFIGVRLLEKHPFEIKREKEIAVMGVK